MTSIQKVACGLILSFCLLAAGAIQAAEAEKLAIGQKAPAIAFTDIRYLPRTLADFGKPKAIVIVFTKRDCPLVQRYAPKLKALDEAYRERGVQFLALNVGAGDSVTEVAWQAVQADWALPVGKDFDGAAAQALGATRTPEALVLDAEQRLVYRGRIDDQLRLSGTRPGAVREDLREALDDVLAGREVRVSQTPVDGCLIEFDALTALPAAVPRDVTYCEHVAPILARHCQECHRPETSAPFSLLSYRDARDHAATLAEVVRQERMPPAFASREPADIVNARRLTAQEQALILAWVKNGQSEGDPKKLPRPREFSHARWKIGQPDLELKMLAAAEIPAEGFIPYRYVLLPHIFLQDTWVQRFEILPGNRAAVHHANLAYVKVGALPSNENFITGYVPGGDAMVLNDGVGFKIPAGSVLALQIHYVTSGKKATDRTSVGLVYAKEPIQKELRHFQGVSHRFAIPPGAAHHPVQATRTFAADSTGIGMFSHMHLRGKDMTFRALYPDKPSEVLLAIPNYNFDWQISYRWATGQKKFPMGTRYEVTAHFDNSPFNPYNPDPTATVREGEQTFQEMMYGFLFYTHDDEQLNLQIDPKTGRVVQPVAVQKAAAPAADEAKAVTWNLDQLGTIGGNKVTVVGQPKVIDAPGGKALEFGGVDDGIFLDTNPLAGLKQFTVEVIFKPYADGPKEQRFFHLQESGSENRVLFETRLTDDRQWFLDTFVKSGTGDYTQLAKDSPHPLGPWYAAALTVDSKQMKHYVNGKQELSTDITFVPQAAGGTSLGVRFNKVFWYKGAIRQVRITPRVLTPEEFLKP